jgi:hypothetical protein
MIRVVGIDVVVTARGSGESRRTGAADRTQDSQGAEPGNHDYLSSIHHIPPHQAYASRSNLFVDRARPAGHAFATTEQWLVKWTRFLGPVD